MHVHLRNFNKIVATSRRDVRDDNANIIETILVETWLRIKYGADYRLLKHFIAGSSVEMLKLRNNSIIIMSYFSLLFAKTVSSTLSSISECSSLTYIF